MNKDDPAHILLVEDTISLQAMYGEALAKEGYRVSVQSEGRAAMKQIEGAQPDLLLLDLKLRDMDGMEIMHRLRAAGSALPVIVITGHGSINAAVDAMRAGACDFLVKPFSLERLRDAVRAALAGAAGQTVPAALAGIAPDKVEEEAAPPDVPAAPARDFGGFIGTSPLMLKVYEHIENAARSNATVFITGESGTGKEVCAEAIHKRSARAARPFDAINCAAIPRDLMESELFGHVKGAFTGAIADRDGAARRADGGTLFLDEIGELSLDMQTKLLRFLQDLSFLRVGGSRAEKSDVRIICATNRNPAEEVRVGRFREDLFFRLHVLPLYMPPLRDRGADIIDIAQALLRRYAREEVRPFEAFSEEAESVMAAYRWPGNIRQLQNVIRNIVVMHNARLVTAGMLPPELRQDSGMPGRTVPPHITLLPAAARGVRPLAEAEREIIEHAIAFYGGNILQAAAALEISPSTIYRKKAVWERIAAGAQAAARPALEVKNS